MITLAIFRKMAEDGVAGLVKDVDFFLEEAPLQDNGQPAKGVWLVSRGGDVATTRKGLNLRTTIDFYVAFADRAKEEYTLRAIQEWLRANKSICALSGTVGREEYAYAYSNIRIRSTMTPQNEGVTENGKIVKVTSVLLVYDEN